LALQQRRTDVEYAGETTPAVNLSRTPSHSNPGIKVSAQVYLPVNLL